MTNSFLCHTWRRFVAKLCDCELNFFRAFGDFSRVTQLRAGRWCNENVRGIFYHYCCFHIYVLQCAKRCRSSSLFPHP